MSFKVSRVNIPLTNKKKKTIGILRIGMKDNMAQDQCNLIGKNKTIHMTNFLKMWYIFVKIMYILGQHQIQGWFEIYGTVTNTSIWWL
jgi:hypothetical protein